MKPSRPNATKGSAPKLRSNPTSTGTTIYEYLILVYLALEYLLHDDPRHVEYRKTRKRAEQGPPLNGNSPPTPPSPPSSNARTRYNDMYPSFPPPASYYTPPEPLGGRVHRGGYLGSEETRSRFDPSKCSIPSKQQMSEAWGRMRAARRSRVEPPREALVGSSDNILGKPGRSVHWGSVQVNQYEQVRYESPPESLSGAVESHEMRTDEGIVTDKSSGEVKHSKVEREVWGAAPRAENEQEVWDAVPNEGEIWGSMGPNM